MAERDRSAAVADLYRRNVFRVTGLPVTAGPPAVRRRQQQLMAALAMGADVDLPEFARQRPEEAVRAAFARLADPRQRLLDEALWRWGPPKDGCSCHIDLHFRHDAAVLCHSELIDEELADPPPPGEPTGEFRHAHKTEYDEETGRWRSTCNQDHESVAQKREARWAAMAEAWTTILDGDGIRTHLRCRAEALDDPRLTRDAAARLADELPGILLRPLVELAAAAEEPARLAAIARRWPAPDEECDRQLEAAAEPRYQAVEEKIEVVARLPAEGMARTAAARVLEDVLPALRPLAELVPPDRHRRTRGLLDAASTLLNNSAVNLVNQEGMTVSDEALEWLDVSQELAVDPESREQAERNRAGIASTRDDFEELREHLRRLVRTGRRSEAKAILRRLRTESDNSVIAADLALLTAAVDGPPQPPRRPAPDREAPAEMEQQAAKPPRRPVQRPLLASIQKRVPKLARLVAVVAAVVLVGAVMLIGLPSLPSKPPGRTIPSLSQPPSPSRAPSPAEGRSLPVNAAVPWENAPVGACFRTAEEDWRRVTIASTRFCAIPHWGVVLGYPALGPVPSPYPGDEQSKALSAFECRQLLAVSGLPADQHGVTYTYPGQQRWRTADQPVHTYATCAAYRLDGADMPAGPVLAWQTPPGGPPPVPMSLASRTLGENAPTGACLTAVSAFDPATGLVPVVRCGAPHQGQVLGYPIVAEPGSAWPGDEVVRNRSTAACDGLVAGRPLPPGYGISALWPDQSWWSDPQQRVYATCIAYRTDGGLTTGTVTG